jgi:hypothetical protein
MLEGGCLSQKSKRFVYSTRMELASVCRSTAVHDSGGEYPSPVPFLNQGAEGPVAGTWPCGQME